MSARNALARFAAFAVAAALVAAALASMPGHPRTAHDTRTARGTLAVAPDPHAPYPDHFPPGAGDDIAARSCVICHSAMLVTQQAKDSLGWEKTLALMEKWGAPMATSEHDSLRTYLMTHFGARPAGR